MKKNAYGDKYEGQFKDGKRDGEGTYTFANGDIRITFDKNLRTYNTYKNLFKLEDVTSSPVFLDDNQVLEVKFSQQLYSYITDILSTIPSVRSSISKYVLSQRFINHDPRKDYIVPAF